MKATSGNLRIDQNYKIVGHEYLGKFLDGAMPKPCDNCGMLITNIAIVEGSSDHKKYEIGIDCASTLTAIEPSAIKQVKKQLASTAKFIKFLKTECKTIILPSKENFDKHFAFAYRSDVNKWESFWRIRFSAPAYIDIINKMQGIKIIVEA